MAKRPVTISYWLAIGLGLVCLGPVVAVAVHAGSFRIAAADLAALKFTFLQAALSALLSVLLAVPLARALARRDFPGKNGLLLLMGAPFILPVIVAVLGLIAVFGRNGWISELLSWFGIGPLSIYGLHGVVLAHVFFNLPLVTRLIYNGWQTVPAEHFRLAAVLGFSPAMQFRVIERRVLTRVLPGALALVFLLCTTSFAVALTLGGGPKATTVELAIYQAFRFEFDLGHATGLAMIQVGLGVVAAAIAYGLRAPVHPDRGLDRPATVFVKPVSSFADYCIVALAGCFLLLPIAAILMAGLLGLGDLGGSIFAAIARSIFVALVSTMLVLTLSLPFARAIATQQPGARWIEVLTYLTLAVSPLVIGTGVFLVSYRLVDPVALALPITALTNAMVALPFAVQALLPALRETEARFVRLSGTLDLTGWPYWRIVLLPRLRPVIGFVAGLTAALSIGDLGVIALFADPTAPTLPLYVYQLMGSYQNSAAEGAALILVVLALALYFLFEKGGRGNAAH